MTIALVLVAVAAVYYFADWLGELLTLALIVKAIVALI